MKRYLTGIFLIALAIPMQAQQVRQSSAAERNIQRAGPIYQGLPDPSVRAQILNEQMTQNPGNARWVRNILRELDLTQEKNAPLYFPVRETNGTKNFFTTLFHLLSEGKIKVYNYENESFDDDNALTFKEMLDDLNIDYDTIRPTGGSPTRYVVNSSDIPSREVSKLFVKEAWYFDQNNSLFDVKTVSLCPIVHLLLESGMEVDQALFWVKYEDIRPYIKNDPIMTSNINNAKIYTVDDFFRRRMYEGEIIKTDNLRDLPLSLLYDKEELPLEKQRIEDQLKSFNEALWTPQDTTTVVLSKRESRRVSSTRSAPAPKEKAPKAPAAEKVAKSAPTRTVRR